MYYVMYCYKRTRRKQLIFFFNRPFSVFLAKLYSELQVVVYRYLFFTTHPIKKKGHCSVLMLSIIFTYTKNLIVPSF